MLELLEGQSWNFVTTATLKKLQSC